MEENKFNKNIYGIVPFCGDHTIFSSSGKGLEGYPPESSWQSRLWLGTWQEIFIFFPVLISILYFKKSSGNINLLLIRFNKNKCWKYMQTSILLLCRSPLCDLGYEGALQPVFSWDPGWVFYILIVISFVPWEWQCSFHLIRRLLRIS